MKKILFIPLLLGLIACSSTHQQNHLEFMNVPMGLTINEFCDLLLEKDSTLFIADSLCFLENDTCFYTRLLSTNLQRYKDPHYKDSILVMQQISIKSTPKTKIVFIVEHELILSFEQEGEFSAPDEYLLIEGYYAAVWGYTLAYNEYPNYASWTTRYRTNDGRTMIKDNKSSKFEKGKETYDLSRNTYSAMWKWNCGEILCSISGMSVTTLFLDAQSINVFEIELQNVR